MRKIRTSIKLLPILLGLAILLTSCNSDSATKRDENTLNVWMYNHWIGRDDIKTSLIESLDIYAEENNIELQLNQYDKELLSHADYILKRNIAINNGEVDVVIDNYYGFKDMEHLAMDYSTLDITSEIPVDLSNITAVPLYYYVPLAMFNNSLLEHYGVELKGIDTVMDYYELKEELKSKGCTFELNYVELPQIVQYHLLKNNIGDQFENQETSLRESLGSAVMEILNEIDQYGQQLVYADENRTIYDLKTRINLYEFKRDVDAEYLSRDSQLINQTPFFMQELDQSFQHDDYYNLKYFRNRVGVKYLFIPNNATKHGEGFANYILSSEPQAKLLFYPFLMSRTSDRITMNQSPEALKMINLNEDYSAMNPLGYPNSDIIDEIRAMGAEYMREKGFEIIAQDTYGRDFVDLGVAALVVDALENGYNDNKMQRDLDKLVSDYKLYYTKGQ